jgi:iron complex outermembrane receptor protein
MALGFMSRFNNRPSLRLYISFRLAAALVAAVAEVAPAQQPVPLPPVTVMGATNGASLTSPPISQAAGKKKEVPGGFTLQGIDSLNQGRASSMDDLFQNAPGLVMLSENGVEISKVFIRGSGVYSEDEPAGVQYLIDGLTLNQGDGEIILEDFDVGTFKYAEVYRGANALQYGGLGLGGAVNFVPFTGYDAAPLAVRLEGGSFGFTRDQISTGGVDGPFDYYVSISARYRDGWRDHSTESTEFLFSDFGYKFSDRLENRFYVIIDQTDRGLPGALTQQQMEQNPQQAEPLAISQDWRKDWYYFRLADKLSYQAAGEEASAGVYWWHRNAYEPNLYIADQQLGGIGTFHSDNLGALFNSTTRGELLGGENVLTAGFNPTVEEEVDQYYQNLGGQKGSTTGADGEWSLNAVLYAQLQHYLTEKFSLLAGIQAAYAQRHFSDYFHDSVDGDQSANLVFQGFNPKFGAIYELTDKDQLFANYSRSWQPPSFDDMVEFDTGPDTSQTLTPLRPQSAWTSEVGTRGEGGRFKWELALYYSWVRDELMDVYNPATDIDLGGLNIPDSIHRGIEAGLETRLLDSIIDKKDKTHAGDRLTLRQDFTLTDLRFNDDPDFGNNRIAGVPMEVYQVQLMYESPRGFYAGPNLNWIMNRFPVDNANTLYASAYALVGFRAGCRLGKGFSVFFDARNLLDKRYASSVDPISSASAFEPQVQVFHPGDPRSFYGGVSWIW